MAFIASIIIFAACFWAGWRTASASREGKFWPVLFWTAYTAYAIYNWQTDGGSLSIIFVIIGAAVTTVVWTRFWHIRDTRAIEGGDESSA